MRSHDDGAKQRVALALTVSIVGYALLALSAVAVTLAVGLATGYLPCITCFTLTLLTFRLTEIHWILLLLPPLVAACVLLLLSKARLNSWIATGLALSLPYLLLSLMFVLAGAGEFPLEVAIPWTVWAFVVGAALSIAVDKLRESLRR